MREAVGDGAAAGVFGSINSERLVDCFNVGRRPGGAIGVGGHVPPALVEAQAAEAIARVVQNTHRQEGADLERLDPERIASLAAAGRASRGSAQTPQPAMIQVAQVHSDCLVNGRYPHPSAYPNSFGCTTLHKP